jgi:hypothetical protein
LTAAKDKKQARGKETKGKPPKRGVRRFAWLLILVTVLAIAGAVAFARLYPTAQTHSDNSGGPKAAIVDQLYNLQPNEAFITEVTTELENCGFEVDLYQGDQVTVDLYRRLPSYGYKLIIFRAHSGILSAEGVEIERTLLFTNEPYSWFRYGIEQLDDRLAMARVGEGYPMVFGIPPKFISKSMEGRFDNTVIIMMGCSGIYYPDLATAFVDKGASVYLAWTASVNLGYVDRATSYLIAQLCSEKLTIEEAVNSTMNVIGPDPKYEAALRYYPRQNGDITLEEL